MIASLSTIKNSKELLRTKVKSHGDEEIDKVDFSHTCLEVISLDSALKKDENYYSQVFLKECKCIEKKIDRFMTI